MPVQERHPSDIVEVSPLARKWHLIQSMKGNITKKDFFSVWSVMGFWTALEILVSRQPVALQILIKGIRRMA
jgi:hypothetical protein